MKLTINGLKSKGDWEKAGIALPAYDVEKLQENTKKSPGWIHVGIGNIFRIFLGTAADDLIASGDMDSGITCIETFDFDVVDKVYKPYDNLALGVMLRKDGSSIKRVIGSLAEAIAARPGDKAARGRMAELFCYPGLQLVTYTITEKGYVLRGADGSYAGFAIADFEAGPEGALSSAISVTAAMLYERYLAGAYPIALVSTDNVAQNGKKFREAVLTVATEWKNRGYVTPEFIDYLSDEDQVAFPWSMIDKITPRPSESVQSMLEESGVEDMGIVITDKKTYIAPFVNAEGPQYLVIEDHFPNGRPPLEKAGFYMTDRDTVNAAERMKVTVCLNPIHTALAPFGCLLEIPSFAGTITDPQLSKLAEYVGEKEGMEVVIDPGILSPRAFLQELLTERFPNPYIPDTPQRITVDASQMMAIRFGVTINAFIAKYGDARRLKGIPIAIAGWLRYLMGISDQGTLLELSPDPMKEELQKQIASISFGDPESVTDQLKPILSNEHLFGVDLYQAGIGDEIETLLKEMIAGTGAVRNMLKRRLT